MKDAGDIVQGKITDFTDLIVWQKGHMLAVDLYGVTKAFPRDELFGLTSQIRRCASSITANIAEGFGRKTAKDQLHFYYQSNGSILELRNHLLLARDVQLLEEETWELLNARTIEVHKLMNGLIKVHSSKL